jgi:hypothetical protein
MSGDVLTFNSIEKKTGNLKHRELSLSMQVYKVYRLSIKEMLGCKRASLNVTLFID